MRSETFRANRLSFPLTISNSFFSRARKRQWPSFLRVAILIHLAGVSTSACLDPPWVSVLEMNQVRIVEHPALTVSCTRDTLLRKGKDFPWEKSSGCQCRRHPPHTAHFPAWSLKFPCPPTPTKVPEIPLSFRPGPVPHVLIMVNVKVWVRATGLRHFFYSVNHRKY